MNKLQFHRLLIAILIVLNGFLIFHLVNRKHHGYQGMKDRSPKERIIKKLHFDKNQVAQYEALIEEHHNKIKELDQKMAKIKHEMLHQISTIDPATQDSLFNEIGRLQAEVEKTHFQHFLAIKSLCREDQLDDFEELSKKLADFFSKKRNKRMKRHD